MNLINAMRSILVVTLGVLAIASGVDGGDAQSSPEAIVQTQIDAYNAHDLDAFVATFSADAKVFEHPAKPIASGESQLRERYIERFKEQNLHAEIVKRIVMGNIVVFHEKVTRTFPEGPGVLEVVAIYQIENGKIAKLWLIFGPKTLNAKS
jgi:hypothetical protein